MKFPQAYVFFKAKSKISEQDVRDRFDESIDFAFIKRFDDSSVLHSRVRHARDAITRLSRTYPSFGSCVVISTRSIDEFFQLKFSQEIEAIMWIESSSDATKIRSALTLYGRYWHIRYGSSKTHTNYRRIAQILGEDCPPSLRRDQLATDLESYSQTIDREIKPIIEAFDHRLQGLCHMGKYSI